MIPDSVVAKSMARLVDCRYSLGDRYRECPHCHKQIKVNPTDSVCPKCSGEFPKGWDCLNSLKIFYDGCGVKFPTEFEDWNEKNYAEKWVYDPEIGRQAFFRFLQTLGDPVNKNYARRGDLLILKHDVAEKPPSLSRAILDRIKQVHPFMRRMINAVLEGKQLLTFPGVYLGNGKIFLMFEKGGKVVPYRFFEKFVVEVRRLIK